MGHRTRGVGAVTAAILLTATISGAAVEDSRPTASHTSPDTMATSAMKAATTITLITGDRVELDAKGRVVSVQPAEGREDVPFSVHTGKETLVLPADAAPMVAAGMVDRRLFDVAHLAEIGYDDTDRADLPVIVIGSNHGRRAHTTVRDADGAHVRTTLASVNGAAVEVDRSAGPAFWDSVTQQPRRTATPLVLGDGVEKIWLDGRVETTLDHSVAQVGAPTAWEGGLDGDGVTVAVLDTGIDDTHPDLKGRVDAAMNFSESKDAVDRVGHGTHVASTLAGSGTASDGRYRGVAPGARLLNGKVLDDDGYGLDSDIIAGMEWAVDQGARVVNLSIGGDDTPELDPVEQAIETLTADTGTLFVAAAGNYGPYVETLGSPASAPSALAVGAVDDDDVVARFSARGPATSGLLKPELTAPGVSITAARAAGTGEGGSAYTTFSGTSMATPHVAGAAAILAQQYPDWDADRISATLTAAALPTPNVTAFAQGAGRIDIARAIEQPLTTSPAALDFGVHEYPHEADPVSQQLTYRNAGDEPLELGLSVEAYGPEDAKFDVADPTEYDPFSDPAPDGMFTVEPATVTIPAGGEASVTVAADTRMDAGYGLYGGTVTATATDADITVQTAVGFYREGPMHELTFTVLDTDGEPTADASVGVTGYDTDTFEFVTPDEQGEATVRVPPGTYQITTQVEPADWEAQTVLVRPTLTVDEDIELMLDGRLAEPFDLNMPNPDAVPSWGYYQFATSYEERWLGWFYLGWLPHELRFAQLGPDLPAGDAAAALSAGWKAAKKNSAPDWYHAAWHSDDSLLAGHHASPARTEFARIDTVIGHSHPDRIPSFSAAAINPNGWFTNATDTTARSGINYVYGRDIRWSFGVSQETTDPHGDLSSWTGVRSQPRTYAPGQRYQEEYNVGVFGPSLTRALDGDVGAIRRDGEFWAHIPMFGDGAGHPGYSTPSESTSTLRVDGEEIFSIDDVFRAELGNPEDRHEVPSGAGRFVLSTDVSRSTAVSSVSSRIQTTWTFDASAAPGDGEIQEFPLSVVRFSPRLSPESTAPAGRAMRVPFVVEGAAEGRVKKLTVEVSYDEGESWKRLQVHRNSVLVKHPTEPGSVSLRVQLTDRDGNSLDQTIQRAYLIR